ncbi:MAG: PD40 domain-containing protein [Blastocatellales bacterium]|nr:PD40 domain-containing protein [Blastocatellales bacterium]
MKRIIPLGLSLLGIATAIILGGAQAQQTAALPSLAEPSISPDRAEIAFVSGGDIWTAPAAGGEARLLVAHTASESRPIYSPDGKKLAFISTRTGGGDIYVLTFASGELKRLTFEDGAEQLSGWSRDGRWVYYHSTSQDIAGMSDLFRIAADGGTPVALSADRYVTEAYSASSPDENVLAFTGNGFGQWWRRGSSHIDQSEIWLRREGATPAYEKLSEGGAKETWAMWSGDGRSVFYVSDRGGAENIWVKPVGGGAARQVTKFRDGRLLWPNISADGKSMVFERNFRIWRLDTASGNANEVPIAMRGAPTAPGIEHLALNNQFQELALAPDGRKVAFTVRGEIFAAGARESGDAARVTNSLANDSQIAWAPDSKRMVYASERDGAANLYLYDFATREETRLTNDSMADAAPRFSPDGKMLAFIRDGRELRVLDMESRTERLVASGHLNRPPFAPRNPFAWSPDNKWIAYLAAGEKSFRNVYIAPAGGGEARQASFLANVFGGGVAWSPDGTFILFGTNQRTESGQVARIDLLPRTPRFREDQFRDLFREQSPRPPQSPQSPQSPQQREQAGEKPAEEKKGKDVEIVFDGIRRRLSLLPVGVDVNTLAISPDGKVLLLSAVAAGQFNLYTYSLDELAREPAVARQLTSTPGFKADAQFSPDGKEVYFLENGRIASIAVDTRQQRAVAATAEMDVDFSREKMEVFAQGWRYLRDFFYDPKFHGADWNAVRRTFEPQIAGARTPDEMRRLMSLMVGELNASHLGVNPPGGAGGGGPVTGKLGLRFDRATYERDGKLKITEIVELGPAALTRQINIGDYLTAVDGTTVTARTNLDELLAHKVNRRVELTISNAADGSNPRTVAVRPVNTATEKRLLYRQWVNDRREYVARASNGRLGYVHMIDMSAGALEQLYLDLDAENHTREGVVVDVRNNNGGFVNVYAIDVFARRPYLQMTVRGQITTPARTMLGQRALEAPTILVTNRYSLSDAEDFTEGYRTLGLGKVIGEPTAGWIIYTTNVTLIDGSGFRIPFIRITDRNGADMELNPRPVDIRVTRPIGEGLTGRDSQLDAAVRELLKQRGDNGTNGR